MADVDLSQVEVLPLLPNYFRPWDGDPLPDDLIGATILNFGAVAEPMDCHGGGLVIDYRKPDDAVAHRVVFAHTDIAMWIEFQTVQQPPATSNDSARNNCTKLSG